MVQLLVQTVHPVHTSRTGSVSVSQRQGITRASPVGGVHSHPVREDNAGADDGCPLPPVHQGSLQFAANTNTSTPLPSGEEHQTCEDNFDKVTGGL